MADANKQAAKAAEKEAKAAKWAQRKQSLAQLWQAFNIQRKQDKQLVPLMLLALVGIAAVFFLIGLIFNLQWMLLPIGIALGLIAAMFIFTRRLERSVYDKAAGQAGAAGWALENMRSGVGMTWKTTTAVAVTTQMDAVHRVVGVCGIVLVGEGEPRRVRPLMNQQKKRLHRIAGQVPIYEIMAGEDEGQVPVRSLQRELMKLPRNIKKDEVYSLAARLESADKLSSQAGGGLPKGPLPKNVSSGGMNRRARRAAERNKKG